ncbi:MAG TPA: tRNA 4-thiouridine(8) synthase ThiI, partial [Polyangia bacterium]
MSAGDEVILVRWGEIFLKGDNRSFFERALVERATRAVSRSPGARTDTKVVKTHGRLVVWPGEGGTR